MNYEIVYLNEKKVTTLKPERLFNSDAEITKKIQLVWHDFSERHDEVQKRVTDKPICIYSNYENDEKGAYDVSVGYEISKDSEIPNNWHQKVISAGKYAKFIVKSNTVKVVKEFWQNLWKMDLPRKFDCDFEECQNMDMLNGEVHVFISIK